MTDPNKQLGDDLMMAAIDCAHSITEDEVTLRRDPGKPGCSLTQLRQRVLAAHLAAAGTFAIPLVSGEELITRTAQPVQQPAPVAADLAAFNAYFCNTLSCDGVETEQQVEDCRVAAYDAWCEATRRADARAALAAPVAAPVAMPATTEWRELAEQCLKSMKQATHFGKTGQGRPPEQTCMYEIEALEKMLAAPVPAASVQPFQQRVQPWMMACFGAEISADTEERNHRFFEESTELVQAQGMTASEAHQLVDYVYGRPVGELAQEVGGVMVTLAALCLASNLDMHQAAEVELARIWTKVVAIRAKQAAKPKHSPLPQALQPDANLVKRLTHERDALGRAIADAALKAGMYNGEVPLAGPHLIMLAQHLGDAATVQPDCGRDTALMNVKALAWKWHRESVKQGFACSEPAQELFEVLGWPADPGHPPANVTHAGELSDEQIKEIIFDCHAEDGMGQELDLTKLCRAILNAAKKGGA